MRRPIARPTARSEQQSLGLGWPALQPLGHARVPPDDGAEHRLAFAAGGHGPRDEIDRGLGVAAKLGEIYAKERDRRRDVHQQASRPSGGRLEALIGIWRRPFGQIQAAPRPPARPPSSKGQPGRASNRRGRAAGQFRWQGGQPPLHRRALAVPVEALIEVLLDQPGGLGHLPGGYGVAGGVVDAAHDRRTRPPRYGATAGRGLAAAPAERGAGRRTTGDNATSRGPHRAVPGRDPPARPVPAGPGCRGR